MFNTWSLGDFVVMLLFHVVVIVLESIQVKRLFTYIKYHNYECEVDAIISLSIDSKLIQPIYTT